MALVAAAIYATVAVFTLAALLWRETGLTPRGAYLEVCYEKGLEEFVRGACPPRLWGYALIWPITAACVAIMGLEGAINWLLKKVERWN